VITGSSVPLSQRTDQLVPLPPVLREAVHQHDGRTGVRDMDCDTVAELYLPVFQNDCAIQSGHSDHALKASALPLFEEPLDVGCEPFA
jgi:hypothetical protein